MSNEPGPEGSLTRFAQRTPLPELAGDTRHPVSVALPVDLQRALTILVADFASTSFDRVKIAYRNALLACRGSQCLELAQATIDNYLELTVAPYRKYSTLVDVFTPGLCAYWQIGAMRNALVINIKTCGAVHFAMLLQDCLEGRAVMEYALRAALQNGRDLYIRWVCTVACGFPDLPQIVVDSVWSVRHDKLHVLLSHCMCCTYFSSELTKRYLKKTLSETASWMGPDPDYDMGPLVTWMLWHFIVFQHIDLCLRLTQRQKELLPDFVNFCISSGACVVAIFMGIMVRDWPLVRSLLKRRPEELQHSSFPLQNLLVFMRLTAPPDIVLESLLAVIDKSAVNTLRFNSWDLFPSELHAMYRVCLLKGLPKWAIFFQIHKRNWDCVTAWLSGSRDPDIVDMILVNAARFGRWNIVKTLLPVPSSDPTIMAYVCQRAAGYCQVELVERLLPCVDLALLPFMHGKDSVDPLAYFRTLMDFAPFSDTISKLRIVLLLVRQGLISHIPQGGSVVELAIKDNMPTLARLLVDAGMVSREEFRQILQKDDTRRYLSSRPALSQAVDRSVQNAQLDCPRTLQDSCRLVLSHHLGYGPGKKQRIEQLPLPRVLKHQVALSDLCEPVEAKVAQLAFVTDCF